jgi:hypothetical protein
MSVSVSIQAVDPKLADQAWDHFIADDMSEWLNSICEPIENELSKKRALASDFEITDEVIYGSKRNNPEIRDAVVQKQTELVEESKLVRRLDSLRFMMMTHDSFLKEVSEYSEDREWLLEYLVVLDINFMSCQSSQSFSDYYGDISTALDPFFLSVTTDIDFESLIGEYNPVLLNVEQQASLFSNLTTQGLRNMKTWLEKNAEYRANDDLLAEEFERCLSYLKDYRDVVKYAKDNGLLILVDVEGDKTLNVHFRNRAEEIYEKLRKANLLN